MEGKSKALDNDLEEIPSFQNFVDELKHEIVKKMEERYEKLNFMKGLVKKIQNHEESKGDPTMIEAEFLEEFNTMEHFYSHFHQDLNAMLFGAVKTERHTVNEYFGSSNASKFNRHEPYDYENPPNPIKESDDEEYDYDYEDEFEDDEDSRFYGKGSLMDSVSKLDDQGVPIDYDDALRNTTTTHHKQRLRNRRERNEENSRARDTFVENYPRDERSRSRSKEIARSPTKGSIESQNSNVQENLGRLAEYVKSAEFKKRKDLEVEGDESEEDEEIEFKNTKNEGEEDSEDGEEYVEVTPTKEDMREKESYDYYPDDSARRIGDSEYDEG